MYIEQVDYNRTIRTQNEVIQIVIPAYSLTCANKSHQYQYQSMKNTCIQIQVDFQFITFVKRFNGYCLRVVLNLYVSINTNNTADAKKHHHHQQKYQHQQLGCKALSKLITKV